MPRLTGLSRLTEQMIPSRSEFSVLRGRRFHVRRWGTAEAPLLVMLHGWCDVSASWQFVVDAFRKGWNVVAPDLRGFGLSQGNQDPYWFPDYIADLDALLECVSPGAPADLVGHSLGGNAVCLYAGIRPERVRRLVNLEGLGLPRHDATEAPGRYAKWLEQVRGAPPEFRAYADRAAFARRLRKENPRLDEARASYLAEHLGAGDDDGQIRLAADPWHRLVNPVLYRLEEIMAVWRQVTAPVLWVTADDSFVLKDIFSGDAGQLRERVACFRDIREAVVADSGHNMHHDQPEAVARLIEDFLG